MRAGVETLAIMEADGLLANAAVIGEALKAALIEGLDGVEGVIEVRGLGRMLGVALDRPCGVLLGRAADAGLLISVTSDKVIRLVPALILSHEEAAEIAAILLPLIKALQEAADADRPVDMELE